MSKQKAKSQQQSRAVDHIPDADLEGHYDQDVSTESTTVEQTVGQEHIVVEESQISSERQEYLNKKYKGINLPFDIEEVYRHLTPAGQITLDNFLQYMREMGRNVPNTAQNGADKQALLHDTLYVLFNNLDNTDFGRLYPAFLDLVDANCQKGEVFHVDMAYRFSEEWPLKEEARHALRKWITLMLTTANRSRRRKEVREIKDALPTILAYELTEKARTRLMNFYGV